MEVEALLAFLAEWEPEEMADPEPRGPRWTLEEAIAASPETYAGEALSFAELDLIYIRALFGALKKAPAAGRNFEWGPVLDLAQRRVRPCRTEPAPLGAEADPISPGAGWSR